MKSLDCQKLLKEVVGDEAESLHVKLDEDSHNVFTTFLLAHRSSVVEARSYKRKRYGTYGGYDYFRPDGWIQFQVAPWCLTKPWMEHAKDMIEFDEINDWPIAYHGTSCGKLLPILSKGLRKPGELPEVVVEHGQCGADEKGAIYLTPSLWYASHPVYAPLKQLGHERWAQAVLKLRVRPGCFKIQGNTLANRHWDRKLLLDPNFDDNESIEWLVQGSTMRRSDVVIVGIMLREIGARANRKVFGYCPHLCPSDSESDGPEYTWSRHLAKRFKRGGFLRGRIKRRESKPRKDSPDCREARAHVKFMKATQSQNAAELDLPQGLEFEKALQLGECLKFDCLQDEFIQTIVRGQALRREPSLLLSYGTLIQKVLCHAENHEKMLRQSDLLEWHGALMNGLLKMPGCFRTRHARCGTKFFLPPDRIHKAMRKFVDGVNYVMTRTDISCFAKAGWCMNHFIQIHPFQDGNGRVSRLLAVWVLKRSKFAWSMISLFRAVAESRKAYIVAMASEETRTISSHVFRCCLEAISRSTSAAATCLSSEATGDTSETESATSTTSETVTLSSTENTTTTTKLPSDTDTHMG